MKGEVGLIYDHILCTTKYFKGTVSAASKRVYSLALLRSGVPNCVRVGIDHCEYLLLFE
jgi:hypothetical protein